MPSYKSLSLFIILLVGIGSATLRAQVVQSADDSLKLVQFSGVVVTEDAGRLVPMPFVTVAVEGTTRGTYSDDKGFFSLVVEERETVVFTAIGFETVYFEVPDTLTDTRYTVVQYLTQDTINLPVTVVYPWPSREHFKLEFLEMNVDSEMAALADANVAEEALSKMRSRVIADGNETADYYLRQQAQSYYSVGQLKPQNIFNPFAWKQFIDAWKRGDFKRKKKDDN